jgi:hypothetical protein
MKLTYIYVKKCTPSGLLYLGKTVKNIEENPNCYLGSGKRWLAHLKFYGYTSNEIETYILHKTTSEEDLKQMGRYYSILFDVENSREWANLKIEEGDGGMTRFGDSHPMKNPDIALKASKVRSDNFKNGLWKMTDESKEKMRSAKLGKQGPWAGKTRPNMSGENNPNSKPENRKKLSDAKKGKRQPQIICPICGKTGGLNTMKQRHIHLKKLN